MKLPKRIIIASTPWEIKYDKKQSGGSFREKDKLIIIGTLLKKHVLDTYLHEIIEAVLSIRNFRYFIYPGSGNEKIQFSFNHADFENLIPDILMAIKDIIKPEFIKSMEGKYDNVPSAKTGKRTKKAKKAKT